MAHFSINFRSQSLQKDTHLEVIIPPSAPENDIPTLYLLHGMYGNCKSWSEKSRIEHYVKDRGIAVVMPEGENSFYNNMKYGEKYFTYISDELVKYTRRIFRLSDKREKTFIAGLSMGGYGAFRTALLCPQTFAAAASLSGCVDLAEVVNTCCTWDNIASCVWGDDFKKAVPGSDADLMHIIENYPADSVRPRLFAACGTEDYLYHVNVGFSKFMQDKDFEFVFHDGEGAHTWDFWDRWIRPAMDFLTEKIN